MLKKENTLLVVIDIQGKLAELMYEKDKLFASTCIMIKAFKILEIPILWVEQIPESLGKTIKEISSIMTDIKPISKFSFSCCGNDKFMKNLKIHNKKQILLTGIETHICVYQTAKDLVKLGYETQIVSDAVSSRIYENKKIGLKRMEQAGAKITSLEMALFEILKNAKADKFRDIIKLIK